MTIPGSPIWALSQEVREQALHGAEVLDLTIGDFDPAVFPIPEALEREVCAAYRSRHTNYPAAEGNSDLRRALSAYVHRFFGLDYSPGEYPG